MPQKCIFGSFWSTITFELEYILLWNFQHMLSCGKCVQNNNYILRSHHIGGLKIEKNQNIYFYKGCILKVKNRQISLNPSKTLSNQLKQWMKTKKGQGYLDMVSPRPLLTSAYDAIGKKYFSPNMVVLHIIRCRISFWSIFNKSSMQENELKLSYLWKLQFFK